MHRVNESTSHIRAQPAQYVQWSTTLIPATYLRHTRNVAEAGPTGHRLASSKWFDRASTPAKD
eukprot:2552626-Pleurochrysis_carterae.AAC.1